MSIEQQKDANLWKKYLIFIFLFSFDILVDSNAVVNEANIGLSPERVGRGAFRCTNPNVCIA